MFFIYLLDQNSFVSFILFSFGLGEQEFIKVSILFGNFYLIFQILQILIKKKNIN